MACLNLSNGTFAQANFSTADINVGNLTITRTPTSILIEHASFASPLSLTGRWEHHAFGGNNFLALLRFIDGAPGSAQRTIFIVDFTGASITTQQVHEQGTVANSVARPQFHTSPVNETLAFVFSSAGSVVDPLEVQRLAIVRSDNGDTVMSGPISVPSTNGLIRARITATELIIDHPTSTGFSDSTTGPRPTGVCNIVDDSPDFGEAVLGASNPALATVTRTVTIRNDGLDCLSIDAIGNNAPYTVTAATLAQLPVTLDPGAEFDADILFAPAAPGTFNNRILSVTTTPANSDDEITCDGEARMAIAQISASAGALNFGTLVHPGTATRNFTVSNTGELDLTITIAAAPAGSDFAWAPIAAPGLALPVGATTPVRIVTYTTSGDGPATPRTINVVPSSGASRTIVCSGAGCIPNAEIFVPAIAPLAYGQIERGFRTVRFIELRNDGDSDLQFTARIGPAADPAHAALFGLVLPETDITNAPSNRLYSVLPATRCGPGAVGVTTVPVAVSFFASGANGFYNANLIIEGHNASNFPPAQTWIFPLSGEIIDPVPVDIALVLDRSGSMNDPAWSRNKMEAALSGAKLLVQMLRDTADDRCALVRFNETPDAVQSIALVGPNRAAMLAALGPPAFVPDGATNIAGGAIVGFDELDTAHPSSPPVLRKAAVVLTDGIENRCFQIGGAGPWFSITGRDASEGMARPDGTPQDTDPLPVPPNVKVYAIGLGGPGDLDATALDALSTATGGSYQGAEDLTGKHYFKLEKYFTQIFMETAGLAQISDPFFTIAPGTKHPHQFDILPGDVNAMVVLYDEPGHRLPFYVVSPKGEVLSGTSLPAGFSLRFRSTPTARFAEFFFPHKEPDRYVGLWTVWVEHPGYVCTGEVGRDQNDAGPGFLPRKCEGYKKPVDYGIAIGAGSNLRMQPYVEPGIKYVGESFRLNAEVAEAGLPVKGSTVRVLIDSPTGQHYVIPLLDDGAHQDGTADDGDYGGVFTQTYSAGNYQLEFRAEGVQGTKPYVRSSHRTKAIHDKRQPPGDGGKDDGGGGGGDCCRKLLRALSRQERILRMLIKEQQRDSDTDKS